jgi:hypothetical protein
LAWQFLQRPFILCPGYLRLQLFYSIMWRLILVGVGTAIFLPPNSSIVMSALPANRRGIASGTVATARNIGMMIGVTQAGLIFNMVFRMKTGGETLTVYDQSMEPFFMAAFQYAMLSGAFLACLGIFVAFMRGADKNKKHRMIKKTFFSRVFSPKKIRLDTKKL